MMVIEKDEIMHDTMAKHDETMYDKIFVYDVLS